jgi:uncharacterized membrane protein
MKRSSASLYINIIAITFLISYLFFNANSCSKLPTEHKLVKSKNGEVKISSNEINDGKAHFFTYKKSGKRINFFARVNSKGNILSHFDACFRCYKNKKGYRLEGSDLVCNECNLKFKLSEDIWENKDCSPIMLKNKIENAYLIIKADDLEKGSKLF